jgi:hypothetical protein
MQQNKLKLTISTHNAAFMTKKKYYNIDFEENAKFFAQKWRKSPKVVLITALTSCLLVVTFNQQTKVRKTKPDLVCN